ncbi:hypothetical protein RIF29_33741 [Crotalaria pallida]|uniref:GRF-type domain-containing protein n=1 Tax=Crotalaria pallida TaxID=3830 RepID=A0AAN9E8M2_CROPI
MSSMRQGSSYSSTSQFSSLKYVEPPLCKCEVPAFLRTSRTVEHYGWKFWGCRFYQKNVKDSGCGFFQWFNDEDDKERMPGGERMKIGDLEAALDGTKLELKSALRELKLKKKELKEVKMELNEGRRRMKNLCILCFFLFAINLYLIRV